MINQLKKCPYCAGLVHIEALKCKHCKEIIGTQRQPDVIIQREYIDLNDQRKWIPGIAGLLSFLIPGAGQMYKGNVVSGIFWFIFTIIGYFLLVIPGLILHLICIVTAASGNPYKD